MRDSPCRVREQQRSDIAAAVAAYRNGLPNTGQPDHEINEIIERMKRKEAASAGTRPITPCSATTEPGL